MHKQIRDFFVRNFDVRQEKEDELETIESIRKGIEFKGTNLWVLIFATFVASLGLNTNSTAVIIGAMLISPLMGPIMGFGLGLGISDFDLIKRSFRNFATATVFSVITSTLFFLISPISEAQSELLARTQPTVYDVLIAFFGGLAGIVASSTKSKGNVIPGVAIATALMPPLCTAGFGLASGNLYYFFGAFYLYFINTVFISLATYVVVRLLKYPKKVFLNKQREKIVTRYVGVIVFFTIVPSLFLSYNLIRASYFNDRVRTFVADELSFPNTQILSKTVTDTSDKKEVKVVLIGETVPETMIANARAKMPKYGLKNVGLVVQQGFGHVVDGVALRRGHLFGDVRQRRALLPPQQFRAGVRHNPAHPAPERRHIPQRAALLPRPQQRLLHRVLAVAFVAKHRVADMVQQFLDFQRFRLKRARIHRRTSFHLFSDI